MGHYAVVSQNAGVTYAGFFKCWSSYDLGAPHPGPRQNGDFWREDIFETQLYKMRLSYMLIKIGSIHIHGVYKRITSRYLIGGLEHFPLFHIHWE